MMQRARREPDPPPSWWLRLGRLLPPPIRERVYEPVCWDCLAARPGRSGASMRFALYAILVFLGVACLNFPRVLREGRRLSGLGKASLALLVVASTVLLLRTGYLGY